MFQVCNKYLISNFKIIHRWTKKNFTKSFTFILQYEVMRTQKKNSITPYLHHHPLPFSIMDRQKFNKFQNLKKKMKAREQSLLVVEQ